MSDTDDFIREYLDALAGPKPEDAWHCLVEYGPDVLPDVRTAYGSATDVGLRCLLMGIMAELRDEHALPLLSKTLDDPDDNVWRTALDTIVTIGGRDALAVLLRAQRKANLERRDWIVEAVGQTRSAK